MFLQRLLAEITANSGTQPAKVEAALPPSLHNVEYQGAYRALKSKAQGIGGS